MTKVVYIDESDKKLILETRQKLDEATKLMEELLETIGILGDRARALLAKRRKFSLISKGSKRSTDVLIWSRRM